MSNDEVQAAYNQWKSERIHEAEEARRIDELLDAVQQLHEGRCKDEGAWSRFGKSADALMELKPG